MKVAMQPPHSCGTLESRIKIFGCTVQELYITFYPHDLLPISPSKTKDTIKGRLIRDRRKMYDHSGLIISRAAMSKSKIRF